MRKISSLCFLFSAAVSISQADNSKCTDAYAPCSAVAKQKVMDMINSDPQHMAKAKEQLNRLLTEQATKTELNGDKRKAELKKRQDTAAQNLLNFAKQRHEEAVARRNAGLSLSTDTLDKDREKNKASDKDKSGPTILDPNLLLALKKLDPNKPLDLKKLDPNIQLALMKLAPNIKTPLTAKTIILLLTMEEQTTHDSQPSTSPSKKYSPYGQYDPLSPYKPHSKSKPDYKDRLDTGSAKLYNPDRKP